MAELQTRVCVVGMVQTNCYLVWREEQAESENEKSCVVIDPGDGAARIQAECERLGLKPQAILLTHGHFDHILAAEELRDAFQIPVYAGKDEQELLENPEYNLTAMVGKRISFAADRWLSDGEELELLGMNWKTLFTPGHTAGSVCYYVEEAGVLFAGDTLFCESVGRTDFPTGSWAKLASSISRVLFVLPEAVNVCPGHGEMTTIGHEKTYSEGRYL